jgi:hypothetical protein
MLSVWVETSIMRVNNGEIRVRQVTFHWPEASNDNVIYFNVLAQKFN